MMAAGVVFIGGRFGVGKSSVGFEMRSMLSAGVIKHCVIDGDMRDMAYASPIGSEYRSRRSPSRRSACGPHAFTSGFLDWILCTVRCCCRGRLP